MSIEVDYYSDVLCVWSYATKRKIDEIKSQFADQVSINYRYMPLFSDMHTMLAKNWSDKGGLQGYNKMMHSLNEKFPYVEIHPEIGLKNLPHSSSACHLFLKAVSLLEERDEIHSDDPQNTLLEQADWKIRLGYFKQAKDISRQSVQMAIAEELELPITQLEELLTNGEAMAALSSCTTDDKQKLLEGSPTFVFNEGRQRLFGNIGYHIIAANLKALLDTPNDKPSWY